MISVSQSVFFARILCIQLVSDVHFYLKTEKRFFSDDVVFCFYFLEFGVWTTVNCDEETYEIELVDKMVLKDGRVTSSQELIKNTKKLKYLYYLITTGIMVLLVIITA